MCGGKEQGEVKLSLFLVTLPLLKRFRRMLAVPALERRNQTQREEEAAAAVVVRRAVRG